MNDLTIVIWLLGGILVLLLAILNKVWDCANSLKGRERR
jgi:hypothetical protein